MEKSKQQGSSDEQRRRGRWRLFLVIAVCAAPIITSYFMYYVVKPESRTNYGTLIDPRHFPIPSLASTTLDGQPAGLEQFNGKWIMLQVAGGDCDEACKTRLFAMRQLRLMQGKDMDRIERVWLITDSKPLDSIVMREFDGTNLLRVDAKRLEAWLPVDVGTRVEDHLYVIDPRGNLMMRFPKDADPNKVKKDLSKLLRASSIG